MKNSFIFGTVLSVGSMLLIYNGMTFFSKEDVREHYLYNKSGRWYNVILGLSLLLVTLTPHKHSFLKYIHYSSAIIFFAGSALSIVIFSYKRHRKYNIAYAMLITLSLVGAFIPLKPFVVIFSDNLASMISNGRTIFTLFIAEWMAIIAIGIHFLYEATNKNS